MNFFKKDKTIRRYSTPKIVRGYSSIPFEEITLPMDVQTLEDIVITTPEGSRSVQKLKVFCDTELLVENTRTQQKADRLLFQGDWFECRSCRLSENTPLRHYTATFIQCLDQPDEELSESEDAEDEHGGS